MTNKQIGLLSELILSLQNDLHTLETNIKKLAENESIVNEQLLIDCVESTKKEIEKAEKAIKCAINYVEQLKDDVERF